MATRRSGLGRGLEALIPKSEDNRTGYAVIPIDRVSPNPHQPRSVFDEETLASLAASIVELVFFSPSWFVRLKKAITRWWRANVVGVQPRRSD